MDAATPSDGAPPTPTQEVPAAVPPVVLVLVAHDPGDWFRETLASIAAQTYADLSVLVIDAASETDPTPLIAEVLPAAHVHRLEENPGFGAAVNQAVALVEGAAFYVLCHDDVALEPDTIRALVEEAFRSNAGLIGPKLVDWNDPRRLLQVGASVDKTGALAPIADRLELDQEQHDAIRDVFVVPGACTLVRADLFGAIGGFDDQIAGLGDDLDLCWRAHVVGARVMIAPVTRVRHLEALGERVGTDDRRRQLARHRLRSSLINYGRWHRARVLPQALLFALVEAIYSVCAGHPHQARDIMSAWPWNLRRHRQVRARRKAVRSMRTVPDHEVRELQVGGSARLSAFIRGQIGHRRDDRDARATPVARSSSRDVAGALREGGRQFTTAFAAVLAVLLLVSSRDLIVNGIPAIGQFAKMPSSPSVFLQTWWSGWRHAGLGSPGAQPTGDGLLGALGYVFLGALGLMRTVLILGTVPVGAIGAWRLARPIGSPRASVASFAVYLAIPVPYNAIAEGSWSGLLVYALAPWLLLSLGRASGAAPFGPANAAPDEPSAHLRKYPLLRLILGLGLALAVVATLVPFVIVLAVAVAAGLTVGSVLCFRVVGLARMVLVALGASALAVALNLPWALDLVAGPSPWASAAGVASASATPLTLGEILRFQTGPWGAPPLGWAFLLAGALPVIIGRSWRLEWAVRAWMIVLGGWAALWASQQGHLPGGLPNAEVILAPVAAALALAAALGLAAFETDLRAYRFGWRQVLAVLAALGVVLGAAPLASGLLDGRWRTPSSDYQAGLRGLLDDTGEGAFRAVWIGDPAVLPIAGWELGEDLAYGTSDEGAPTMIDRFVVSEAGASPLVGGSIEAAVDGRTSRLGRLLGPMGVRYVIVQSQLAPTDEETAPDPEVEPMLDTLAEQLDLKRIPVADGLTVYRNLAWVPSRAVLPEREGDRTRSTDAAGDDLRESKAALKRRAGVDGASGRVPATGDLLVASTADDGWKVRVDGVALRRSETYGWANQFGATRTGAGTLAFDTPISHRAIAVGEAVLWLLVLWAWRRARRRSRALFQAAAAAAPRRRGPAPDLGRLAEPEGVDA